MVQIRRSHRGKMLIFATISLKRKTVPECSLYRNYILKIRAKKCAKGLVLNLIVLEILHMDIHYAPPYQLAIKGLIVKIILI